MTAKTTSPSIVTSPGHCLRKGDVVEFGRPRFWRVLIGAHRIKYASTVASCSFIVSERRMTWGEWASTLVRLLKERTK